MFRKMILAAAVAMTATTAAATPSIRLDGGSRAYVRYSDLDLQSPTGRSQLVHRIRSAADMICDDRINGIPFVDGRCYLAAVSSGRRQMYELVRR